MADDAVSIGFLQRDNARMREELAALKNGDGDGTSTGMEARVAKLEAHVDHIREDLGSLKGVPVNLATLQTRVDHLPSKGFILTSLGVAITAIVGILTILSRLGLLSAS